MRNFKLIAVHGRSYTGKDSVADYLVENYGFTKVRFADGIYWIAEHIFRMKRKNRRLLQFIGQGARFFWSDIWVWATMRKVQKLLKQGKKVVISDLRQANEFIECFNNDFLILHTTCSMETKVKRARERDGIEPDVSLWERPSETGADGFVRNMIFIYNDGTLEQLHWQIDKIMGQAR